MPPSWDSCSSSWVYAWFTDCIQVLTKNIKIGKFMSKAGIFIVIWKVAADQQMRERFDALIGQLTIPTLYGISALGTKICLYTYDVETGTLEPEGIERDTRRVNDRAPSTRWNLDITMPNGEQRLREVVAHIKTMCGQS